MNRAKVLFADLVTKFGDWISLIGLNYYFFLKGQWAAIAIFSGLQLAIPIFISPISLFVRGNIYLKKTLILSNLFRALFMFFITLLIAEKSNVIIIIFLSFCISITSSATIPIERRFHRSILVPYQSHVFNSIYAANGTLIMILSGLIGELIFSKNNFQYIFAFDSFSFVLCAIIISLVKFEKLDIPGDQKILLSNHIPISIWQSYVFNVKSSLDIMAKIKKEYGNKWKNIFLIIQTHGIACLMAGSILVSYAPVSIKLHKSIQFSGALLAALGIGSLIGSIGGKIFSEKRLLKLSILSIISVAMVEIFLGITNLEITTVICYVTFGILANLPDPFYWSEYYSNISDEDADQFYAFIEMWIGSAFSLGGLLFAFLGSRLGISLSFGCIGVLGCIFLAPVYVMAIKLGKN